MGSNLLFSAVLLAAGACLLAAGTAVTLRQRRFLAHSVTASGTVVELLTFRRPGKFHLERTAAGFTFEPRRLYRPVVHFKASDGRTYKVSAPIAAYPADFQIGDSVTIRYDPAQPSNARFDRPLYLWFAAGMLIFFGFFAIGMGLLGIAFR